MSEQNQESAQPGSYAGPEAEEEQRQEHLERTVEAKDRTDEDNEKTEPEDPNATDES